ncbi:heme ABC exporter ATP-binding protein CcmA [Kordiimonas aestuarii]|uniref:heme ABC exporter ATP-binding protein CcmA n=1 Tax=Kordiimonas aestuarii TaxID=1005925 RepID=UPI0021D39967|nr:heme ABC exporter ATP-binding protein CcmA [Kordiimonas aestuarii]
MTGRHHSSFETRVLKADGLATSRGGRRVFEGLSFELHAGGLLYLRGPNGSGKSTLLRLVAGFVKARAGTLTYGDSDWTVNAPAYDAALIYAGHDNALKPVLTLRENALAYVSLMTGEAPAAARLDGAARLFGLTALLDRPARFFSSGQKHRANLMRFALLDRPLWLMDEPTVGLDAVSRQSLADLMTSHLAAGGMIIAATHDPIGVDGDELVLDNFTPKLEIDEAWL